MKCGGFEKSRPPLFVSRKPLARRVVQEKPNGEDVDKKTPLFNRINVRSGSCAIIEAEVCPDHIHMLVEIPPKVAVSSFL